MHGEKQKDETKLIYQSGALRKIQVSTCLINNMIKLHVYHVKIIKEAKIRPKTIENIKVTLWNEPGREFTVRQLMMEMGFFVLLHANNLTRATSILKHSTAVLSSSGELVEVDSAVLCKSDNQDDEVRA